MKNKVLFFLCSFCTAFFTGVILSDIHNIKVRHHVIRDKRIRKDMRIVAMSDLHGRSFGKDNEKLINRICALKPDVIITAGDIMTAKDLGVDISASVDVAEGLLKELSMRFPVYFGMGNHESRVDWMPWLFDFEYKDMMERFEKSGAKILDNREADIPEYGVKIFGINIAEDLYLHRGSARCLQVKEMNKMIGRPDKERFNILIGHDPEYLPSYAAWGADLSLSGHYHGGIMRLPVFGGVISPKPRLFPDYSGGMFRLRNKHQLVLCGLGVHTIPVRVFNPAELVVIDIKKERG